MNFVRVFPQFFFFLIFFNSIFRHVLRKTGLLTPIFILNVIRCAIVVTFVTLVSHLIFGTEFFSNFGILMNAATIIPSTILAKHVGQYSGEFFKEMVPKHLLFFRAFLILAIVLLFIFGFSLLEYNLFFTLPIFHQIWVLCTIGISSEYHYKNSKKNSDT
jgi:hypothetical protein